MYNKVILAGNLTRDIEIRYTPGGAAVGNTGLATNRKFKDQSGQQKEEVMFIDITFFGRTAEIANQYLHKGSKVLVDGRLRLDTWTAQDGSKRSKHSIIVENLQMIGGKDDTVSGGGYGNNEYDQMPSDEMYSQPAPRPQAAPRQEPVSNIPEIDISEDEIPF
ncbi:MAG: single-stranded DNA-binding protein [Campylobacterales bacterium]|nr:single-stranded DNA-binding protein [Campylobacterales bacterium]